MGAVDRVVTLGAPHNPPPAGVADQTRGILNHVSATTPGNFHEQARTAYILPFPFQSIQYRPFPFVAFSPLTHRCLRFITPLQDCCLLPECSSIQ